MWSDNETHLDLLDVSHLAAAVKETILNPDLSPVTVGVFGDWGSGKSSLVSIVERELEGVEGVLCLSFDGWLFEGYEDAKAALMGSILDELKEKRGALDKAGDLFKDLIARVNWMRVMGLAGKQALTFMVGGPVAVGAGMAGQALSSMVKGASEMDVDEAAKLFKEAPGGEDEVRKNIRKFRSDFEELLKKTEVKRLVVFIDNLDRCLPDTVIETLEAVRLFLFVPGTAFVISADERLVREAVRQRFPQRPSAEFDVGRDYLEKLVQVPVRIPPLGPADVRRYMNLLFAQLHFKERFEEVCGKLPKPGQASLSDEKLLATLESPIHEDLKEILALTQEIGDVLAAGLRGNPRQVKRFLNALLLRISMAKHRSVDLKRRVLAKLMVLEYLHTESFRRLAEWQADQAGQPAELAKLEARAKSAESAPAEAPKPEAKGGAKKAAPAPAEASAEEPLDPELALWLTDPWLKTWLRSEPSLVGEDLRSYFFVSRDRMGPLSAPALRLSPEAQVIAEKLTSAARSIRQQGLDSAHSLPPVDANGVFQLLAERVRQADVVDSEDSPLTVMLLFVAKRPELVGEVLKFLGALPVSKLGMGVPPRVAELKRILQASASVDEVLRAWSTSGNKGLATSAGNMLRRPERH